MFLVALVGKEKGMVVSMNKRWMRLLICLLTLGISVSIISSCKAKEKYNVGTMVSNAYIPESEKEGSVMDAKAKGYEYDYDNLTYDLVWSDEFDYEGVPDDTKWNYDVGGSGWGNNELQYYTDNSNALVKDGKLIIEARKESHEGMDYTSARLVSRGKGDWLYGKIEVSAKS